MVIGWSFKYHAWSRWRQVQARRAVGRRRASSWGRVTYEGFAQAAAGRLSKTEEALATR